MNVLACLFAETISAVSPSLSEFVVVTSEVLFIIIRYRHRRRLLCRVRRDQAWATVLGSISEYFAN